MSELAPPDSGSNALAPVQDGWPLRTVTGNAVWKLVPPQARPLARVLSVLPATLFVGGLVGVALWTGGNFYIWWMLGKGSFTKVGFLAAGAAGLARFSARLVRWQLRRLASLHVSMATLRGSPPGSLVRVVGTVRAETPFAAAVSGQPAVMTRYEVRPASGPASHQLRGVDFYLDVDGADETIRVSVKDAYFDDHPAVDSDRPANFGVVGGGGCCDTRYREARLAPGDRIEAVGVLVREVDPLLTGGPGRAPGLRQVIRASAHLPLLLRKLPDRADSGGKAGGI
jgi:hypothetical protein